MKYTDIHNNKVLKEVKNVSRKWIWSDFILVWVFDTKA